MDKELFLILNVNGDVCLGKLNQNEFISNKTIIMRKEFDFLIDEVRIFQTFFGKNKLE